MLTLKQSGLRSNALNRYFTIKARRIMIPGIRGRMPRRRGVDFGGEPQSLRAYPKIRKLCPLDPPSRVKHRKC